MKLYRIVLLLSALAVFAACGGTKEEPENQTPNVYISFPEGLYYFNPEDIPPTTGQGYTWVVPPIMSALPVFDAAGRAALQMYRGEVWEHFIGDTAGRVVAAATLGEIAHHFDNVVLINASSHWVAVDLQSQAVTYLGYFDSLWPMAESGLINVSAGIWPNEKTGIINTTGKKVLPLQFVRINGVSDGLAAVGIDDPNDSENLNGLWGFIDIETGEILIPHTFGWASPFSEGFAAVVVGQYIWTYDYYWGFINKQGQLLATARYRGVMDFSEGMAAVIDDSYNWGFIDTTGREVIPPVYSEAMPFSEGLAAVLTGSWTETERPYWGFINQTGREVVPPIYEDVRPFSNGLAAVRINNKWGFIDQTGQMVIPPIYTLAWSFTDGLARVYYGGTATWVAPCDGGPIPFGGVWQILDTAGNVLAVLDYTYITDVQNGMAAVRDEEIEFFECDISQTPIPTNGGPWGGSWGLVHIP
jgi:hypothetical protein